MIGGGYLSHSSLYGATFHVKSSLNAMNVAYTSTRLCPHQDLAYYESKPGFQFLHCIESDKKCIQGGESLLIDVMAAAHEFRSLAPCYFNILTKCHATFVKERNGALMTYTRPHIQISSHCIGGVKENHVVEEIVAVHWAPPFEGQLSIPHELLKSYFEAYAAFELMVDKLIEPRNRSLTSGIDLELALKLSKYANKYTWEYRLNKGEMIIFNNTRMLHARNEFNTIDEKKILNSSTIDDYDVNTKKIRHLVGAYTNIDDTLNTYRVMMKQKLLSRILPNVGNGSPMLQTKI
jgi:gamma-butyrobetaine dioxygenase